MALQIKGLLIGFYEQNYKTWGLGHISPDFTMALCPDDLDRVTDVMEGAMGLLPCLETAGYGHRLKQNIAFGFVEPEFVEYEALTVKTARGLMSATVGEFCRYDAGNERVKA